MNEKVLVIDDELGPRESLRFLLKNEYRVLCADSVDEGIRLLKAEEPDVVVMDIRMPKKSGIEGLKEIRAVDPYVSVIMLTGYARLETAQEALRQGATDYLKKPFDTHEMQRVVGRRFRGPAWSAAGPRRRKTWSNWPPGCHANSAKRSRPHPWSDRCRTSSCTTSRARSWWCTDTWGFSESRWRG